VIPVDALQGVPDACRDVSLAKGLSIRQPSGELTAP